MARYLREDYSPRAAEHDGVGGERYAVAARLSLGADIDLAEAYEWGWAELARIEAEMAVEASRITPGGSVDEAAAVLGRTEYVTGADAYLAWLQDRHDEAIDRSGPAGPGGRSGAGERGTGSRPGPSFPPSSTRACPAITCRRVRPRWRATSSHGSPSAPS
jgi:hypothetical protein